MVFVKVSIKYVNPIRFFKKKKKYNLILSMKSSWTAFYFWTLELLHKEMMKICFSPIWVDDNYDFESVETEILWDAEEKMLLTLSQSAVSPRCRPRLSQGGQTLIRERPRMLFCSKNLLACHPGTTQCEVSAVTIAQSKYVQQIQEQFSVQLLVFKNTIKSSLIITSCPSVPHWIFCLPT